MNAFRTKVSDLAPLSSLMNMRNVTPTARGDNVSSRLYLRLDVIEKVAKSKDGQTLAKIAKELLQEPTELGLNIFKAHRLIKDYDPYPRKSPLWERPDRITGWPSIIRQNAELILKKSNLVRNVWAASAKWRSEPESDKLNLCFGKDLPLPDYFISRFEDKNLLYVRDLISSENPLEVAGHMDDLELLKQYFEWYDLYFQEKPLLRAEASVSNWRKTQNNINYTNASSVNQGVPFDFFCMLHPIEVLECSARTEKWLKAVNIRLIGDLIQLTESELRQARNADEKSLNEIKKGMRMNLGCTHQLGTKIENWPPAKVVQSTTIGVSNHKSIVPSQAVFLLLVPAMGLSLRSIKCLESLNVFSIGDLVQWTEDELLKTGNLGRKSLNEIKEVLASQGFALGMNIGLWPPSDLVR